MSHSTTMIATPNLELLTKRKIAYAIFRVHTIGSIDEVYGEFESDEVKQLVLWKMETRTQFYITYHSKIAFTEASSIKTMDTCDLNITIHLLNSVNADVIRHWWNLEGGKAKFQEYKEAQKEAAKLAMTGFIFRVEGRGFAKLVADGCEIVQTPEQATSWSCSTRVQAFEALRVKEFFTDIRCVTMNVDKLTNPIV